MNVDRVITGIKTLGTLFLLFFVIITAISLGGGQ